jgi:hypothetical protein
MNRNSIRFIESQSRFEGIHHVTVSNKPKTKKLTISGQLFYIVCQFSLNINFQSRRT